MSLRSLVLRPTGHPAGTQQTSWGKTLRFRRDHVANTPQGPTGTGHRCWRPAHPPKGRLTALHSRSRPRHTYGFLQTRPHGSPPALNDHASRPPGELRAAPLPHQCWVPPVRAPVQDSHLRSQTSCPAHRCARPPGSLRSTPARPSIPLMILVSFLVGMRLQFAPAHTDPRTHPPPMPAARRGACPPASRSPPGCAQTRVG